MLKDELETLAAESKARAIAVALHDFETDFRFSLRGDRLFHAASTIKAAVLLALFRAADEGRLQLNDSVHVRNRFFSAADGTVFHVSADRDVGLCGARAEHGRVSRHQRRHHHGGPVPAERRGDCRCKPPERRSVRGR